MVEDTPVTFAKYRLPVTFGQTDPCMDSMGVRIVEWLSSHSTVVQEVPGSNPGAAEKCCAVMELFVNIYLYEFVLSLLCVRVRCFGLY